MAKKKPEKKSERGKKGKVPFPTREQVLTFIRESPDEVGKREIARAFHLTGSDRIPLKALLKELERDGLLERQGRRKLQDPRNLPPVTVIEVAGLDEDGELLARPAVWDSEAAPPKIYMAPDKRSRSALAPGDRVLAKLSRGADGAYEARTIRRLEGTPNRVIGIYENTGEGGRLRPTDKRAKKDFILQSKHAKGADFGELVLAEVLPSGRGPRLGLKQVKVVERLGGIDNTRALSLIAMHEHDLPVAFPVEAQAQADAARAVRLERREDLRSIPLVTIDGADARDFDDAVFAEADDDPKNPGGWRVLVAIADVAHYVRPGDALDRAAQTRGNSVYFPDRVVPMLPEALSNGWCSLVPKKNRPCMAVWMVFNAKGRLLRHSFLRGLMRSAARLTYEQVQAAQDGVTDDATEGLRETVIAPLYSAYRALLEDRERRGTLELDLPEKRVVFDDDGNIAAIRNRERLDSHRLIEEFMIAANVAAASELERLKQPCMYRVHEEPDPVKLEALGQVLEGFGLRLAKGQVIRPKTLTGLLQKVADHPEAPMVSMLILRAQSQARYSPENKGHFGLALPRYAHFTSPIRRYSDLLVHRALIAGLKLGAGALPADAAAGFEEIGDHISSTERRAAAAERDAMDRFVAAYHAQEIGTIFAGRINGVTRFGLFVTLEESGADGLVPIRSLPDDYYDHEEAHHRLVGRRWGRVYRLGETVQVRLVEAVPLTGGLIFELIEADESETAPEGKAGARSKGKDPGQGPATGKPGKRKARGKAKKGSRAARKARKSSRPH